MGRVVMYGGCERCDMRGESVRDMMIHKKTRIETRTGPISVQRQDIKQEDECEDECAGSKRIKLRRLRREERERR